jgi:hypothetical protein
VPNRTIRSVMTWLPSVTTVARVTPGICSQAKA